MGKTTFKKWLTAIALIWGAVIVAGMLVAGTLALHNATTAAVTETVSDPAQDHRLQAAGLMVIRVSELNNRFIAQCNRLRSAPPDCEKNFRNNTFQALLAGGRTASEGQAQFMKFVDIVHRYERKMTPLVQWLEAQPL